MFISGGENVYPAEVEKGIDKLGVFKESVVVPVKDQKWGEVGLCFYTSDQYRDDSSNDLARKMKMELMPILSKYKIPHYWIKIDEMPLLANGKVDRNYLKTHAEEALQSFSQIKNDDVNAKQNSHFMV